MTNTELTIEKRLVTRTDNRPNQFFTDNLADYITIHETANTAPTADAESHSSWLYREGGATYSWHYTVDQNEVYQSLDETEQGWHAGDGAGPGNTSSIGIELCVCDGHDFEKTKDRAALLVAYLEKRGHGKLGVVPHQHFSGKRCPTNILDTNTWDDFLKRVAKLRKVAPTSEAAPPIERPIPPPPPLPPAPNLNPPARPIEPMQLPNPSLIQPSRTLKKGAPELATTGGTGGIMALLNSLGVNVDIEVLIAVMVAVPPLLFAARRLLRDAINTIRELKSAVTLNS